MRQDLATPSPSGEPWSFSCRNSQPGLFSPLTGAAARLTHRSHGIFPPFACACHSPGPQHPDSARELLQPRASLLRLGQPDEAMELFRLELRGSRLTHGSDHPLTLTAAARLADCLTTHEQLEAAEPLLRESVTLARKVYGRGQR